MALYESVFLARQDISNAQVDQLADQFSEIITNMGGTIAKREYWGVRKLAYRIKKNRKAHYVLLNIDAPSDAVLEMERNMRLNEDILRYLTLRIEEVDEAPSVIMQAKSDRPGGRGDRGDRRRDDRPPRRDSAPAEADASAAAATAEPAAATPAEETEE